MATFFEKESILGFFSGIRSLSSSTIDTTRNTVYYSASIRDTPRYTVHCIQRCEHVAIIATKS
jgi:hypothetical protein